VEIKQAVFTTSLNFLSRTIFSIDLASLDSESSQEFKEIVERIMELAACPNVSDFFPVLTSLDLQSIRHKIDGLFKYLHKIFGEQIDRRIKNRKDGYIGQNDFLDVLLDSEFGEGSPEFPKPLKAVFTVKILSLVHKTSGLLNMDKNHLYNIHC
jgi:Cytochrome P450